MAISTINQITGVCVADYYDDNYGKSTYTLIAPADIELKVGGVALTATETIGSYKKYITEVNLVADKNYFEFTAVKDGENYSFTQYVGGKVTLITADQISASEFKKEAVTPTVEIVDANTVIADMSGKLVKVDVPKTKSGTAQSFNVRGKLIEKFGTTTSKFILHIYYEGDDNPKFIISAKHKKQTTYFDLISTTLKQGMNTFEISLAAKSWEKLGDIEYVAMYLGGKKGEKARTIYIVDNIVYEK